MSQIQSLNFPANLLGQSSGEGLGFISSGRFDLTHRNHFHLLRRLGFVRRDQVCGRNMLGFSH